jgi:hypothetical protein
MDKHGNPCPPDKILNPKTGNCVKKDSAIGREIMRNDVNAIQGNGYTLVTQAVKDHNLPKFIEYLANPTINVNKYDARAGNPLVHALQFYINSYGTQPIYREMIFRLLDAPGINVNTGVAESILMLALRSRDMGIFHKLLELPDLIIDCSALNFAIIEAMEGAPELMNLILADRRLNPDYGAWPHAYTVGHNPINHVITYYDYKIAGDIAHGRGDLTNAITTDILRKLLTYKPEWATGIDLSRFGLTFSNILRTGVNRRHTARNAATVAWMRARGLPPPKPSARKTRKN